MVLTSKWGVELPKDVLKMASGLISPSGLAGHRRKLCGVGNVWCPLMTIASLYSWHRAVVPIPEAGLSAGFR